jgi:hypothetical protein
LNVAAGFRFGLVGRRAYNSEHGRPAMAAGVTKRLWEMIDVVDVLEAFELEKIMAAKLTHYRGFW